MANNYRSINIFVSHPFEPVNSTYDLQSFRTNIELLIKDAETEVRKEFKEFEIDLVFEFSDFNSRLPQQIDEKIRSSHFAIVDITENKANIFYEYGLMRGLNIPALLIKATPSFEVFDVPADLKDMLAVSYSNFSELRTKCKVNIVAFCKQLLTSNTLYNIYLNKIWFPLNAGIIHVIAPPEIEKSEFASTASSNYIFLNNLGDIDTVLEVSNFLNRNYRNVKIEICAADEFKKNFEDNLVIIGGPGETEDDGNSLCALMMEKMNFKISYVFENEDEIMQYKDQRYMATFKNNKVFKDYGYFARFPNPFNPKSSVVLIHGIHTFGVLGSAKVFSDHASAQENIKKIVQKLKLDDATDIAFECFFPVDVLQQSVVCPVIDEDNIATVTKK